MYQIIFSYINNNTHTTRTKTQSIYIFMTLKYILKSKNYSHLLKKVVVRKYFFFQKCNFNSYNMMMGVLIFTNK